MARKTRSKGKRPQTAEPPSGATGHGRERQGEEGRLRGLVRYPPGSNGGVHRGPDRQLRINVVRSILLQALAKEGVRLAITPAGAPAAPPLEDPHGFGREPRHPNS